VREYSVDVVVVGAGPAGSVAAWELAKRKVNVLVLEKRQEIGAPKRCAEGLSISGLISSEVGALGVVNGWVQSAALQIPVIDAPANGRAHPLGLMGFDGAPPEERVRFSPGHRDQET